VHHVHLPGMLVVQGLLLLTTPTANAACKVCGREGHNARTCPQRGTAIQPVQQQQPQGRQQGCSICGEPGYNARTHAQHAAAAAERTARGEYVCGYCQRVVSGKERARWLRQLFSVACDASPHLSFIPTPYLLFSFPLQVRASVVGSQFNIPQRPYMSFLVMSFFVPHIHCVLLCSLVLFLYSFIPWYFLFHKYSFVP